MQAIKEGRADRKDARAQRKEERTAAKKADETNTDREARRENAKKAAHVAAAVMGNHSVTGMAVKHVVRKRREQKKKEGGAEESASGREEAAEKVDEEEAADQTAH